MDTRPLRELHLFAGAGGGILAGVLLGHVPVCAVEINPFCQQRLIDRQREGYLPPFPIWDDVTTFDGHPWRGWVDIVSGGFPCQDISPAGKGAGLSGARSGLWTEFTRIIGEVGPRYAFIENSAALTVRGLTTILADLAALGMDARWCRLGADDVGAWHERKRTWILAHTQAQHGTIARCQASVDRWCGEADYAYSRCQRLEAGWPGSQQAQDGEMEHGKPQCGCEVEYANTTRTGAPTDQQPGCACLTEQKSAYADADSGRHMGEQSICCARCGKASSECLCGSLSRERRQSEPDMGRLVYGLADGLGSGPWDVADVFNAYGIPAVAAGVPDRTQRIMALGNGQVPLCAALAWRMLIEERGST